MKLTEYFNKDRVIRDAEFQALGLSNSDPGMSFLSYLDNMKFYKEICTNKLITAVICRRDDIELFNENSVIGIVVSDNPRREYFSLHNRLSNEERYNPMPSKTKIGTNCSISKLASIDAYGVEIGNNVIIDDFVKICRPCIIGDNSIIHTGSVIGGDGFEFKRYEDFVLDVKHCGDVRIGSNVIIWENVTIHKAVYPWDSTVIGDWNRIGAQSHIDHGAKLSDFVEICARCTISGRTFFGDHAFIGPGSIISNRTSMGAGSKVLIGSVVTKNVLDNHIVSGNFAIEHDKHLNRVKEDSDMVLR